MSEKNQTRITAKKHPKRLVLLDAHAIIHRAYHALPEFTSSKGEPTGALYGLATMLMRIVNEFHPDRIAACYDLPKPTHRHEIFKDYKATRKKTDDELIFQLEKSKEIFEALNIPIVAVEGFEADDILGAIVERMKANKDIEIIIASGDMDTLQLVSGTKVRVYTLKKGIKDTVLYDEDAVVERFGFGPELLPDYKGLRGDQSDNIVGVRGIGEKTASDLIKKFGTLENLYKILKTDPKKLEEQDIKPRVIELLKTQEEEAIFSKRLATIRRDFSFVFDLPDKSWIESVEISKVSQLFSELDFKSLLSRLREMLGEKNATTGTLDLGIEKKEQISSMELQETAAALWIINSNITNPTIEDILSFAKTESFTSAKEIIFDELNKRSVKRVYDEIEKPLMPVIEKMEKKGVFIDTDYLKKLSDDYHRTLSAVEEKIWREAGEEFNINSPKQLSAILFGRLGLRLKSHKKTSLGVKSTRESELEKMRELHPIIELILRYRELQKLLSTYIDNIPTMMGSAGRLHAHFIQTGTATGRMSSNNPNLQNIPVKTELGRKIRNAFVAPTGSELLALDYSQIELRVAAFLSKDPKMVRIFRNGEDVHEAVASEVFGVPKDAVDREMRRRAKVINFGILYGMGVNALKANLGTSRDEAEKFYDEYFEKFSGLAKYLENVKKEAAKTGYTETYFGRRRYFPEIRSKHSFIKSSAERMAINAPIQGTAADIIKLAMINVARYIEEQKLGGDVFLILQVHDELVYEIKKEIARPVALEIKKIMENILNKKEMGGIPLSVNCSLGDNWGEMEKV